MTDPLTSLENYNINHSTFGGIVYLSDFNTNHTAGNMAERISRDLKFDESCRNHIKNGGKKND